MTTGRRTVRRPGVIGRSRPRYTWRFWESANSTLAVGGDLTFQLDVIGSSSSLANIGVFGDYTVRRLHGMLWCVSDAAAEANNPDALVWGVGVMSTDAVAAGGTPDPLTDVYDWLAFGQVAVSRQGSFSVNKHPMTSAVIESKSMRRVNENSQTLVLRIEALTGSANDSAISVRTAGRFLVSHGQR